MSLIDDALKRAQSAQGAPPPERAREGHTPLPLPDPLRRRRRLRRNALLVVVPLAAAAAVLLLLWPRAEEEPRRSGSSALATPAPEATALPERPGTAPRTPPDIAQEVFVPPPAAEPREAFSQSAPVEEPVRPPAAAPPAPAPAPREATAGMAREGMAPDSGVSVTRIEPPGPPMVASGSPMIVRAQEAAPAPSRPQEARPSAARERSFVREGTAPSGARLTLDGIVFSDENPAAVVNGRVVSVGSFIEGCEVVRIRPDRVELDEAGAAIVLLLK